MMKTMFAGVAGLALALGSAGALAQAAWNLPTAYPPDNFHTTNLVAFAEAVAKETGGKLKITVHPNASLFKATEIRRAVQTGQAQMGEILISNLENEDPLYGIDVVPFLASSFAESKKLWTASRPAIEKKLGASGMVVALGVPWPPQGIYAKKDINSVEDMKGLKWRAYNVGTSRIGELVGAQPVTIQAAELPQALATGVVNSFMSSGSTGYDSKVWESLTHFYDTQAWIPKNLTLVNQKALDGLDAGTKAAFLKLAAEYEAKGWALAEERTNWYLEQLKGKGMKVLPPSPELMAGFKKIGDTLTADWIKKAGADGEAVVKAYKAM